MRFWKTPDAPDSAGRSIPHVSLRMERVEPRCVRPESSCRQIEIRIDPGFDASLVEDRRVQAGQSQAPQESRLRSKRDPPAGDSAPGSRKFPPSQALVKSRHTQLARLGYSSVPHRDAPLPHLRRQQRSAGGLFARSASTIDAICNAAKNVFDRSRAQVRVEEIDRALAT